MSLFSSAQEKSLLCAVTRVGNTDATSVVLLRRSSCMRKGTPSELRAQGVSAGRALGLLPFLELPCCACPQPHPPPQLPSPDHDIGLEHGSSTFSCLPQGHQGVLGGQLGKGMAEEDSGKGGGLGIHRPGCCRPSLPCQHSAPHSPWGPLGAPLAQAWAISVWIP